jgi:hypothetical protein
MPPRKPPRRLAISRLLRIRACAQGQYTAHVARDKEGPALILYAELASPAAHARRERALEYLARVVAGRGTHSTPVRVLSQAMPHAMSIAKHLRARAEALTESHGG